MSKSKSIELIESYRSFEGETRFYQHFSEQTQTQMRFAVYVPPQAKTNKVPILYWLSGLTCTADNFTMKAGAQQHAAEHGLLLVMPDTSPRGAEIEGEDESYDLGTGAGFYVNATQPKWAKHYKMYDYVTKELPFLIKRNFPVIPDKESIFGHSMGGHGALICALKQPKRYSSVSAFSPIVAPTLVPWGQKAFRSYLGEDKKSWEEFDAHLLIKNANHKLEIFVDQGLKDPFLTRELTPEKLEEACNKSNYPLILRKHEGYDHSYYFIASFIGEHIRYHAKALL